MEKYIALLGIFLALMPIPSANSSEVGYSSNYGAPYVVVEEAAVMAPLTLRLPSPSRPIITLKRLVAVTAYSSSLDETDDTPFITASGNHVREGVVATNFLPFGTLVQIPELYGNRIFVVEDRMHEKHQERIDIWMRTKEEAKLFGKKTARIVIIK
jgi:3D (Asp-Asp-Asp) domain-containing protein